MEGPLSLERADWRGLRLTLLVGEALALVVALLALLEVGELAYDTAWATGRVLSDAEGFVDALDEGLFWAVTAMAPLNALTAVLLSMTLRPSLWRGYGTAIFSAVLIGIPWLSALWAAPFWRELASDLREADGGRHGKRRTLNLAILIPTVVLGGTFVAMFAAPAVGHSSMAAGRATLLLIFAGAWGGGALLKIALLRDFRRSLERLEVAPVSTMSLESTPPTDISIIGSPS